jgi:hypothetical protein
VDGRDRWWNGSNSLIPPQITTITSSGDKLNTLVSCETTSAKSAIRRLSQNQVMNCYSQAYGNATGTTNSTASTLATGGNSSSTSGSSGSSGGSDDSSSSSSIHKAHLAPTILALVVQPSNEPSSGARYQRGLCLP